MFDIQAFAQKLRKYRKERGITQNELAERLLVTPQSVSRWEQGENMPDVAHLCDLAEILSVSLDALMSNHPPKTRCLIGIDAGGTKTEFAMIDEEGRCLNTVILDGSNPSVCGVEQTISTARRGIDMVYLGGMNLVGIFFGGAGISKGGDYLDLLRTALQRAYPGVQIACANDIYNVIACSSQPDACIAAISGTGCVAYSSWHGEVRRVGGMGYLFDSGSGYDLGRDAVLAAMRARDGRGKESALTGLVEEKVGGRIMEHVDLFYKRGVPYVASFAPLVSQAARQGDRTAMEILERNSAAMQELIRVAHSNTPEVKHVILSGGVFVKDDLFASMVTDGLDPGLIVERMVCSPVWGACLQCAQLCQLEKMPALERFLESRNSSEEKK